MRSAIDKAIARLVYYGTLPALWLTYGLQRLLWRPSSIESFIVMDSASGDTADRLERLAMALRLIEQNDDLAWSRLRSGIRRFLIVDRAMPHYQPGLAACVLPTAHLVENSAIDTAMTLVHEATHSRIRRGRGKWIKQTGSAASRAEIACTRREVRFAKRLPGADSQVLSAQTRVEQMMVEGFSYPALVGQHLKREGMPWYAIALRRILEKLS